MNITKKVFLIAFSIIALTACNQAAPAEEMSYRSTDVTIKSPSPSSKTISTQTTTPFPTLTVTEPVPTSTPHPTKTPTQMPSPTLDPQTLWEMMGIQPPEDCIERDNRIDDSLYSLLDFDTGACKSLTKSASGAYIAYITLAPSEEDDEIKESLSSISQVVNVYGLETSSSHEVYRNSKAIIAHLEWSFDDHLIILDTQMEPEHGVTVVYNPKHPDWLHILPGDVYPNRWNSDKTAFYTIQRDTTYTDSCEYVLSGYDFINDVSFPFLLPIEAVNDTMLITSGPYWQSHGRQLMMAVREGHWNDESERFEYGSAYIVVIDLLDDTPEMSVPYYDPAVDFSIAHQDDGSFEIISTPTEPWWCILP